MSKNKQQQKIQKGIGAMMLEVIAAFLHAVKTAT